MCKYINFANIFFCWRQIPVEADNLLYGNILLCKYICCAYIVVVQIFAFTGARYPLKQMLCCVRRETFLCKPHSLGTATHLFTSANLFKTYNMSLREVFCSRFFIGPKSDRCLPCYFFLTFYFLITIYFDASLIVHCLWSSFVGESK